MIYAGIFKNRDEEDIEVLIDTNDGDRNDAEKREHQLVDKGHAIRHPLIFYEVDVEPIGDTDRLMQEHVCLDLNLDDLVYDKQQQHEQACDTTFIEQPCSHQFFLLAFLEATLKVA